MHLDQSRQIGAALADLTRAGDHRDMRQAHADMAKHLRGMADRSRREAEGYALDSIIRRLCLEDAARRDAMAAEYEALSLPLQAAE